MASSHSDWQDLDQRRRGPTPLRTLVAVTLVAAITLVTCELTLDGFRGWLSARPATVAVAVGVIFLVLTVFLVERWLALNESERWRAPAAAARDAYIHSADPVAQKLYARIWSTVKALPLAPGVVRKMQAPEPHIGDALEQLLAQDQLDDGQRVEELSSFIREQVNELAVPVLLATQTIARHEPFSWVIETIAEQQTRLAEAARLCVGLNFAASGLGGAHDSTFTQAVRKGAADIEQLLQAFVEQLHTMRTQLDELPDRPRPSSRAVRWLGRHPSREA